MMYVDFEGENEKDALQNALDRLGLTADDITYEVLQREKKGLLGIGKKEKAKIRVYYKERTEINDIIDHVRKIMNIVDSSSFIDVSTTQDNKYILNIESNITSHLIGKNGNSLKAIQNIVNGINLKYGNKYKILVDIDSYNRKKESQLISNAVSTAKNVLKTKKETFLNPMNPYQRRLIHTELGKINGIKTKSEGEGKIKKIKIYTE
ncbi:MAG TPA: Jag N-terminal domain-containing protein [Spirochaetota bacterium]|nr:Jag N-terminal domain-containing protein [Spirochaetota bacterium]